jgi:hypothetical protein
MRPGDSVPAIGATAPVPIGIPPTATGPGLLDDSARAKSSFWVAVTPPTSNVTPVPAWPAHLGPGSATLRREWPHSG